MSDLTPGDVDPPRPSWNTRRKSRLTFPVQGDGNRFLWFPLHAIPQGLDREITAAQVLAPTIRRGWQQITETNKRESAFQNHPAGVSLPLQSIW